MCLTRVKFNRVSDYRGTLMHQKVWSLKIINRKYIEDKIIFSLTHTHTHTQLYHCEIITPAHVLQGWEKLRTCYKQHQAKRCERIEISLVVLVGRINMARLRNIFQSHISIVESFLTSLHRVHSFTYQRILYECLRDTNSTIYHQKRWKCTFQKSIYSYREFQILQ